MNGSENITKTERSVAQSEERSHRGEPERKTSGNAHITPIQQMISSCTGAFVTAFMVTPLDVVKIRLQAQQQAFKQGTCYIYSNGLMDCLCVCSHCTNGKDGVRDCRITIKPWYNKSSPPPVHTVSEHCQIHGKGNGSAFHCSSPGTLSLGQPPLRFTGTLDAFIKIARFEGLRALWSGLPPTLFMSVPATIFYFTTYDRLKVFMGYLENDPSTRYIPMLAGSSARVGTCILISPIELVRTKLQSQQLSYRDLGRAVKISIQQDGLLSMMRGIGPTLLRDVPFSALYWFGYEYVKALQLRLQGNTQVTFHQSFLAGATAGSIAGLITLPFDVVKTHRQIQMGQAELMKGTKIVPTYTIMAELYKAKGIRALFAGIVPRLAKVAPACAIMISTYEYFKSYFMAHNIAQLREKESNWG